MLKNIEALLNDGMTPEQLYAEAVRINEAKEAAKKKMDKKVEDARKNMLDGLYTYVEVVLGEKPDEKFIKEFEESFKELEDMIKKYSSLTKPSKKDTSDDEAINRFLKYIGAMG